MSKENKKRFWGAGLFLLSVLIFVFWKFFAPGPQVANDYPYVYAQQLREGFALPSSWTVRGGDGLGEVGVLTMWAWPLDFISGFVGMTGLPFDLLEKLFFLVLVLALGVYSISKLLNEYKVDETSSFVASFFYLSTTYLILLIDGGQIQIAVAYAFMPLAFLLIQKAVYGGFKDILYAGLGVALMGFIDIRFVYVLFLLTCFWFFYQFIFFTGNRSILVKRMLEIGVITFPLFVGLHFYWILALLMAKSGSVATTFSRLTETSFLSFATWKHALFLLQPHWFKNVFGKVATIRDFMEFLFIPLLVFSAPLMVFLSKLKQRNERVKIVFFWLFISVVSIFLVKGSNPPFGQAYLWLYGRVPGFSLFRDSTKFFFLVALSYAMLIAFSLNAINDRIMNSKLILRSDKARILLYIFPVVIGLIFLYLVRPVWLGQMTGALSEPIYKKEFLYLAQKLSTEDNFGRILWIPSRSPMGFSSPRNRVVEALRLIQKRPFAVGVVGQYEQFNFLREAEYVGELLQIAGVDYLAYPYPDTRREELKPDNVEYYHAFSDQLSRQEWMGEKISDYPLNVFRTKKDAEHFYIAETTFAVIGSDRIYQELMDIDGFELTNNAIIFTEEMPQILSEIIKTPGIKILVYGKDKLDLAMSLVPKEKFYFPASSLKNDPDESGWWKRETSDFLWWRDFLQQKYAIDYQEFDYGGGWAVAEGDRAYQVSNLNIHDGDKLFVRAMTSGKGGSISFWQGESKIGEVITKVDTEEVEVKLTGHKDVPDQIFDYGLAELRWFEVGSLEVGDDLILKSEGEINVINALVTTSAQDLVADTSMYRDNVVVWDELDSEQINDLTKKIGSPKITYQKLNPTRYKVTITGLQNPSTIVFSETYDHQWKLDGRPSFPLYSLVNGFYVEKDGSYEIYYDPQKYVYPGFVVSTASLVILILLIYTLRKRKAS